MIKIVQKNEYTAMASFFSIEMGMISGGKVSFKGLFVISEFRVKEIVRHLGIGRKLLNFLIIQAKERGGKRIEVSPVSAPYDGDCPIDPVTLYIIYEHLGFTLVNPEADRTKAGNKMFMVI